MGSLEIPSGLDTRNLIDSSKLSLRKNELTSSRRPHFSQLVWLSYTLGR